MLNKNYIKYRLIVTILVNVFSEYVVVTGEYCIKYGEIPSYLYKRFEFVEEEVFPRSIRIQLSLTTIAGTLLYSMDRNRNQLIINLYDSTEATINVEINKRSFGVSLPELCGCQRCRFKILDLWIIVIDKIILQCNGQSIKILKFERTMGLNTAYIIPYSKSDLIKSKTNDAHLWLVNNQLYNNIFPNNEQLSGCIFNVSYNKNEIIFSNISRNIGSKCTRVCNGDICHGGLCYETYHKDPICNCTSTFSNGPFCNDSIYSVNARSTYPYFIFDEFKLSWVSSSNQILILKNKNTKILLIRLDKTLTFEYDSKSTHNSITRSILSENYKPNTSYILVVEFNEINIKIKICENDSWRHLSIPTDRDLRREVFESVTLRSGNGSISMVFKTSHSDYLWRRLFMINKVKLDDENLFLNTTNKSTNFANLVSTREFKIGLVISSIIILILSGLIVLVIKRRRISKHFCYFKGTGMVARIRTSDSETNRRSVGQSLIDSKEVVFIGAESKDDSSTPNVSIRYRKEEGDNLSSKRESIGNSIRSDSD